MHFQGRLQLADIDVGEPLLDDLVNADVQRQSILKCLE